MTDASIPHVSEIAPLSSPQSVQAVDLGDDATLIHTNVDPMDNNCWFIVGSKGDALLIDAANNAEHLLGIAEREGFRITDVLTTHQHADHTQALEEVLKATNARHHTGRKDASALPAPADKTYGTDDGTPEILGLAGDFDGLTLQAVELRGHTPGGIAVLATESAHFTPPRVFVGDSLFPGGVGKTNDAEAFSQLLGDVEARILSLPEETVVHPGHGDSTTVGTELPLVNEWRERGW